MLLVLGLLPVGLGCKARRQAPKSRDPHVPRTATPARARTVATARPAPHRLTAKTLASASDAEVEQRIIGAVLRRIKGGDLRQEYKAVSRLPPVLRAFYATWLLEAAGDLERFFFQGDPRFADDALAGMTLYGATAHAALFRKALKEARAELAARRSPHRDITDGFASDCGAPPLRKLSQRFFALPGLASQRIAHARAHPQPYLAALQGRDQAR